MSRAALAVLSSTVVLCASLIGCGPCDLDPTSAQCLSQKGAPPDPDALAALSLDSSVVWLFTPTDVVTLGVGVFGSDSTFALSTPNLPGSLAAHFTPGNVRNNAAASLQIRSSQWQRTRDVVEVAATMKTKTLTRQITVYRIKPFTLSPPTIPVTVVRGRTSPGVNFVGIVRDSAFSGGVTFSTTDPTGITSLFDRSPALGFRDFDFAAAANMIPGVYDVVIRGSHHTFVDSIILPVTVTVEYALRLAVTPNAITVPRGSTRVVALNLSRYGPVVSPIELTEENVPAGVVVTPATRSAPYGLDDLSVDVTAGLSAAAGTYTVHLVGSWRGDTHRVPLEITIVEPDFELTASPARLTIVRGNAASLTAHINRIAGIGPVFLSKQNVPNGVTVATPFPLPVSSSAINVPVSVGMTAVAGTYTFQIVGNAAGLQRSVDVVLTIQDPPLTLALNPTAVTLVTGGQPEPILLAVRHNGLPVTSTVRIPNLPNGITYTIEPTPLSSYTGIVSIVLTALPGAAVGGPVAIPVEVTAAGVTQTILLSLTILPPDFALVPPSAPITFTQGATPIGVPFSIVRHPTFTGVSISLTASGLNPPQGLLQISPTPTAGTSATLSISALPTIPTGVRTLTITGTANGITRSATITLNVVAPPP